MAKVTNRVLFETQNYYFLSNSTIIIPSRGPVPLKVPKLENFLLAFFAQTKPIWVCDLENKKIKKFFLRLTP
jgi:hypothetical protein